MYVQVRPDKACIQLHYKSMLYSIVDKGSARSVSLGPIMGPTAKRDTTHAFIVNVITRSGTTQHPQHRRYK